MSLDNDYETFAYDIVKFIIDRGGYRPTDELCKLVAEKLMWGPMFSSWPRDAIEANQRARERRAAVLQHRPELPRPLSTPQLPRIGALPLPGLPRGPLSAPQLPRILAPLKK